jgi:RNA polymerase sigma factor (TIGR02999 family)
LKNKQTSNVTLLLHEWGKGNRAALDELMPLVHKELRRRAANYMRLENPGHTLQPTVLVNEAYLRMVDQSQANWQNRAHFFAVASRILRHVLVDHARARNQLKRGGGLWKVTWTEEAEEAESQGIDLVGLNDALERLCELDERQGRIIELRFFGGLSIEETAGVLSISPATVRRDWSMARAWLYRELTPR